MLKKATNVIPPDNQAPEGNKSFKSIRDFFTNQKVEIDAKAQIEAERLAKRKAKEEAEAAEKAKIEHDAKDKALSFAADRINAAESKASAAEEEKSKALMGKEQALNKALLEEEARLSAEAQKAYEVSLREKAQIEAKKIEELAHYASAETMRREEILLKILSDISIEQRDLINKKDIIAQSTKELAVEIEIKTVQLDTVPKFIDSPKDIAATDNNPQFAGLNITSHIYKAVSLIGSMWSQSNHATSIINEKNPQNLETSADLFQRKVELELMHIKNSMLSAQFQITRERLDYVNKKQSALLQNVALDQEAEDSFEAAKQAFVVNQNSAQKAYTHLCQDAFKIATQNELITQAVADLAAAKIKNEDAIKANSQANEAYNNSSFLNPINSLSLTNAKRIAQTNLDQSEQLLKLAQTYHDQMVKIRDIKTSALKNAQDFAKNHPEFNITYDANKIENQSSISCSNNNNDLIDSNDPACAAASDKTPSCMESVEVSSGNIDNLDASEVQDTSVQVSGNAYAEAPQN